MEVIERHHSADRNVQTVHLFAQEKCFSEHEAMHIVCGMPRGIEEMFKPGAAAFIKKTAKIAKTLVFQEELSKRVERCRQLQLRADPACAAAERVHTQLRDLTTILEDNGIDVAHFAKMTFLHLTRSAGKRNHLSFYGPPGTGKSMIMESLVDLHYNEVRVAGVALNKSFDYSSLAHTNACLLYGCKLPDRNLDQWRLLLAGLPLYTDSRRRTSSGRSCVDRCVVYSCCDGGPGALARSPAALRALHDTTIQFHFTEPADERLPLSVFVWEQLWAAHGFSL